VTFVKKKERPYLHTWTWCVKVLLSCAVCHGDGTIDTRIPDSVVAAVNVMSGTL